MTASGEYAGKIISSSLSAAVTDTRESEGQSSCRPAQDVDLWRRPLVTTFNLGSVAGGLEPTDIDLVGDYAYISSDSAKASAPDLFIFDVSDMSAPVELSHLDTGPGISALHVAGNHAYLANDSVTAQLQIVEITDRISPKLITSYRLPGMYGTSSPLGSAVFYKAGKVFLGSTKSAIEELHYIEVSSPKAPRYIAGFEMGNSVNDIFAFRDNAYVASPHRDEIKMFNMSSDSFKEVFSYNDPGATGNGKRISYFLDTLYLGKTKTFSHNELFAFDLSLSSFPVRFKYPLPASIQGLIGYGDLLFVALHQASDGFLVFDVLSSPLRLNVDPIDFPGLPLNFDCDKDMFAMISEGSPIITFISPQ